MISMDDGRHRLLIRLCSGEYEEQYANVSKSSKISTYPESNPTRWTILLDAILLANSDNYPTLTSSVSGAPSGKAVVMLDSGTSYTSVYMMYCCPSICSSPFT